MCHMERSGALVVHLPVKEGRRGDFQHQSSESSRLRGVELQEGECVCLCR